MKGLMMDIYIVEGMYVWIVGWTEGTMDGNG